MDSEIVFEGLRTTVPEFNWLYGRGLVSSAGGGSANGCTTLVWAQFAGILLTGFITTLGRGLEVNIPVRRIMLQFARVAGTDVGCRNLIFIQV